VLIYDPDIIHVDGEINPVHDIEVINLELVLADQQSVSGRRERLVRDVKAALKPAIIEDEILARIDQALSVGKLARTVELTKEELFIIKSLNLLTLKPILYALNGKTGGHNLKVRTSGCKYRARTKRSC
jgi:ribosome-binding ATPase YchF (GTP1/OBG family)